MNNYRALANAKRHNMQIRAAMSGDNPYHVQHINEYCDYVDYMVAAALQDIREALPLIIREELVKGKVQIDIEDKSFEKARKRISTLFDGLTRLGR